jgi:hypothetical protein
MAHEPLDANLLGRVRRSPGRYDADLEEIANTKEFWGHFRKLDEFAVEDGVGKAASARQSLVNKYGNAPSVGGFTFKTVRSVDGTMDFLAAQFDENKIVTGEWERWHEERAMKAFEVAQKAREKKAQAKEEAEALVAQLADFTEGIGTDDPDPEPFSEAQTAEIIEYGEEGYGEISGYADEDSLAQDIAELTVAPKGRSRK